ncbi:hypothetical protein NEOLEDRAFT_1129102 [Neolentinus lepideus HHB14362 ss-1]|uniref:Uncharacterized protein n=1 Tax=Neolentinus lepideus HHB14362 ss-1 TaxID=1314782 RepID=A0A165UXH3_9AGAM|nr:hypothetical protein NEOLEDRAFT_1129102 [Neolentinus lepideus HHB14362 ss-1]
MVHRLREQSQQSRQGCSAYFSSSSSHQKITLTPVGAGLTGAITLITNTFGVLMWVGVLAFGWRVSVKGRGEEVGE